VFTIPNMCKWIHTIGVMKIYEMPRKPRAPFGWKLCTILGFKARICGF